MAETEKEEKFKHVDETGKVLHFTVRVKRESS